MVMILFVTLPTKNQLPESNALLRLIKPLQVKYVPQVTPTGIRDYYCFD